MDREDEPLEVWAARRDRRREADRQIVGTRRVVSLAPGPKAAHINPEGPRALLGWDGHAWVTVGVARNADEAREFLGHIPVPAAEPGAEVPPAIPGLGLGPGRHRKP
ncbi:DUF6087 family protein [Streptomyces diastatochromogenes]|uniref:Uncharacterized protein n=1 Tax=Streptomyces diastatochromogenes TaxID=42236 RepID=A0A233SF10_STRDA|nr:DUF6087 family protein [Streptomyces diastatochromogenes]MCZ0989525.1 DUF6087 family protein [Streptomyces diastatochromogenes]OXY94237.1 hypothetical protein BEK98_20450 [Streptomyces diastatochromogenes]